jgi:hypothetical protein
VTLKIVFTDVTPTITLTGSGPLGAFYNNTAQGNTYTVVLSGGELQGYAVGKVFGPGSSTEGLPRLPVSWDTS